MQKSFCSARTIDSGNTWHFKKLSIFSTHGLPCFVSYDCTFIPINGSEKSSINILLSMLDFWFSNQRLEHKNNRSVTTIIFHQNDKEKTEKVYIQNKQSPYRKCIHSIEALRSLSWHGSNGNMRWLFPKFWGTKVVLFFALKLQILGNTKIISNAKKALLYFSILFRSKNSCFPSQHASLWRAHQEEFYFLFH